MEAELDEVEEGKIYWKRVLEEFYKGFHQEMEDAEEALKDTRLKVPDEVTEETCDLCGRNLVVKSGRFGKIPRLPGLSRVQVYKTDRRAHAGQMPALWQYDSQAQEQARLCLLCLRTGRGVRLYDMGRANRERLPGMRPDDVQAFWARRDEALLHQSRVQELPAGGQAWLSQKPAAAENAEAGGGGGESPARAWTADAAAEEKPAKKTTKKRHRKETGSKRRLRKASEAKKTATPKDRRQKTTKKAAVDDTAQEVPKKARAPDEEGRDNMTVTVIGAGLAGCEAAWQLAERAGLRSGFAR